MPVLVDSNVLLDVLTEDPRWSSWSMHALAEQGDRDVLAINPVIYAEVSIGFVRIEEVESASLAAMSLIEETGAALYEPDLVRLRERARAELER